MAQSKEYYRAQPLAANSAFKVGGVHISGFLCTVSGTLTVTDADGTVLVNALPVFAPSALLPFTAWTRIPLMFNEFVLVGPQSGTAGARGKLHDIFDEVMQLNLDNGAAEIKLDASQQIDNAVINSVAP